MADSNSNPNPVENPFKTLSLDESHALDANDRQQSANGDAINGIPSEEEPDTVGSIQRDGGQVCESSSSGVAWRENSQHEAEDFDPSSPSSSGYAGERGSSTGTSAGPIDEVEADGNTRADLFVDSVAAESSSWVPGKRHVDEVRLGNLLSFVNADLLLVLF